MPTFSHAPSQDDLVAARAGSKEALGRLLQDWRPYLMSRAKKRLRHNVQARFDAEDVVQDTLMKVVERFLNFRGETLAQGWSWIRRILEHALDNLDRDSHRQLRDVAKEAHISRRGETSDLLEGLVDVTETPAAALERQERLAGVIRAIIELPELPRIVVWLHLSEGFTYAELGWRLRLTENVVKKMALQAVQDVRQRLDHHH